MINFKTVENMANATHNLGLQEPFHTQVGIAACHYSIATSLLEVLNTTQDTEGLRQLLNTLREHSLLIGNHLQQIALIKRAFNE